MSYKEMRQVYAEAVKIKRRIEKGIAPSATRIIASQEALMQKQDQVAEHIGKLSLLVQEIKNHLQRKKERRVTKRPLRDEIRWDLYKALMDTSPPKYTRHAHIERAWGRGPLQDPKGPPPKRKRILFALLFYTGARVNELRGNDVQGVVQEGRLRLVLHKQRDAIVRVIPDVGREEVERLAPEIEMFFKEKQCQVLGQSFRKPGQVMHAKAWITYVNREITKGRRGLDSHNVLSSHSFRVGFVTRHIKHAKSDDVSRIVGHKNVATTANYARHVINEDKDRELLNRGY